MKTFRSFILIASIVSLLALSGAGYSQTVPVTSVNTQPVQPSDFLQFSSIGTGPQSLYTVPAGKRLVVEYVSANILLPSGQTVAYFFLGAANPTDLFTAIAGHYLAPAYQSPCGDCAQSSTSFVISQSLNLYVEPGQALTVGIVKSSFDAGGFAFVQVTGHLIPATLK